MTPRLVVVLLAVFTITGCAATVTDEQNHPARVDEGGDIYSWCAYTTPGMRIWRMTNSNPVAVTPDPTCHPDTGKTPR